MWSILSLPLILGPLLPKEATPDMVRSMDQIELFDIWTVNLCSTELLEKNQFLHLAVCKEKLYLF